MGDPRGKTANSGQFFGLHDFRLSLLQLAISNLQVVVGLDEISCAVANLLFE